MLALASIHPVFASLLVVAATMLCCTLLLSLAGTLLARRPDTVTEDILRCLPQTQCGQCGHPGCRPYAEAIAAGAPINRCPPGGNTTIHALAKLLDVPPLALDPVHGIHKPREVAYIREAECIGCVKCIVACPVDAIVGASGQMHTVIAAQCTGCDLCVEPCPVDCIEMRVLPADDAAQGPSPQAASECIRCGHCERVCPVSLLPQQLYWYARGAEHANLERHGLFDCIECGACSRVCPSEIPLVAVYRDAKRELRNAQEQQQRAQLARQRFEARQDRLHAARQLEQAQRSERGSATTRAAQVEAAVARVRARTRQTSGVQTPTVTDAVERARRKALERVAKMAPLNAQPGRPPPSVATLQRLVGMTERKLQRARQKHAAACAAADAETAALLAQAITRLEQRLATARRDLAHLQGADA